MSTGVWLNGLQKRQTGAAAPIAWKWSTSQLAADYVAKVLPGGVHPVNFRRVPSGPVSVSGTAKLSDATTIATLAAALHSDTLQYILTAVPNASTGVYSIATPAGIEVFVLVFKDYGSSWKASTSYEPNVLIHPTAANANGHYYKQTTAGSVNGTVRATSGSSEPTWPTGSGATVVDGGITWTEQGTMLRPMIHGPIVPA